MPTLHWIWKDKVVNHHLEVPYRILQKQYTFGDVEKSENKIIHGDNLDALKSLLPEYEGKVKCIYIDPPYNTGSEWWVYNDNVSDPKLKKWLHQVVWKEWEDLTRHDKWLCMMYPRLKLLHKLLTDDGAIFISIDDNEQASLKLIMDEIFWGSNFVTNFIWEKRTTRENRRVFSISHDYIACYAKIKNKFEEVRNELTITETVKARYKNPDNDNRWPWQSVSMNAQGWHWTDTQFYEITLPNWKQLSPPSWRCWIVTHPRFQELVNDNRIWFGKDGSNVPRLKKFLSENERWLTPHTLWTADEVWTNDNAAKTLKNIFEWESTFETPKPHNLVERIIEIATNPWDLILDSFAWSGTTAHAVLNLNARNLEEEKRKFILIETEEYAETITAERVKRVINWYGKTEWTGGDFEYLTLGTSLMTDDGLLSSEATTLDIRSYICYTETGSHLLDVPLVDHPYWLARSEDRDHYFYFERESITILDRQFLSTIVESQPYYTIWADQCHLSASFMKKEGITFRKIPRDIRNI